jgi:hypothetical protein
LHCAGCTLRVGMPKPSYMDWFIIKTLFYSKILYQSFSLLFSQSPKLESSQVIYFSKLCCYHMRLLSDFPPSHLL